MQLDSQFPTAPQPLGSQARKQAGLGEQQPLLSGEPRSGLTKLLELSPDAGCVLREARPLQGPEAPPWETREARPRAVRGKKCENASPECATPFSVVDCNKKGSGASDPLPLPSPLPQVESPSAVPRD